MSAYASTMNLPPLLPWTRVPEEERRFRRILTALALVTLLLSLVMPFLPVTKVEPPPVEEEPPRYARIILQQPKPIAPPPEVKAPVAKQAEIKQTPAPKPKPAPAPTAKPQPDARQQAQRSGVLALRESLADLRDDPSVGKLNQSRLSTGGASATRTERSILTSKVASGSGGINTSRLSRDTGGGVGLAGRSTSQVESPIGAVGPAGGGPGQRFKKAGRTDEEIQLVFDRNKGAIFGLYNRALRGDPSLQGKMVLRLTIAPSGAVTDIGVVSTELSDRELVDKLVLRIKRFDFGAKDVDTVTVTYPIEFFPS